MEHLGAMLAELDSGMTEAVPHMATRERAEAAVDEPPVLKRLVQQPRWVVVLGVVQRCSGPLGQSRAGVLAGELIEVERQLLHRGHTGRYPTHDDRSSDSSVQALD